MLDMCHITRVTYGSEMRGRSGRIVIEVDPQIKRRLHTKLAAEERTLKDWFLEAADRYLSNDTAVQLPLRALRRGEHE